MFWRFGGYANISAIDSILEKPDFTLEDLLDESDLIQELKQHNAKLVEYLREDKILETLLEYVTAPKLEPVENPEDEEKEEKKGKGPAFLLGRPRASSRASTTDDAEEDEQEKKRNRYAYVSAEVLSSDNWSIYEALMENPSLLRHFWSFLKLPAPLDPLQASYFTKVNESLFDKKTEEMVELLKSLDNAVPDMLRHVDCPMIMDLLLKIISLERTEAGQGIVEWLHTKDVMPTLLSFLGPEYSWATQTSAGDFMKAIITVSANASQNEQACIGPNELTRQLVSKPCIDQLIGYMLGGGNSLTVGVGIIIEVIRKNNSDYDPDVGADPSSVPSSRDPIYLGTLLRMFAERVPDFMNLIMNAQSHKQRLDSTFGGKIEPLGFDRFKTCELMAELLHCSNMALLNEVGSEDVIAARDVERQRLRAQGQLTLNRGEDGHSTDDLTMRGLRSQPEEGRRLGVTNVSTEDDFEEVNPSGEMTEDTSHEFIKAEDEIPVPTPSSFLDKDDDDFVDEPLSSPRLNVTDDLKDEPDLAELIPAPLSPTKPKPAAKEEEEQAPTEEAEVKTTETTTESKQHESAKPEDAAVSSQAVADKEATPAESKSSTEDEPAIVVGSETAASSNESPTTREETTVSATEVPAENNTPEEGNSEANPDAETGEASIIVGHRPEPATVNEPISPVVGDFLKVQFVEHNVVPTILSFFFSYPWNNFLHNVVYDIVQQVFNGPMDRGYNPTLAISLFEAADITNAIIKGQQTSEESQTQRKTRMGFMGHLTLIAEEVVKFTERHPPELLSETVLERVMSQDWINYVEGALAETRERDNAILGGVRPEVALSNRAAMGGNGLGGMGLSGIGLGGAQSGSNALAEAGLNGGSSTEYSDNDGNGSGLGSFSISQGVSGSGFGSSSDEEDNDDDDNDEDVNEQFKAYTDPLNSSSLNPPSIPPPPPPPPPLNIPPSRARLQLAARLAMHQKNAATSSQEEGGDDGDDDELRLTREPDSIMQDPFGDDAEDDSDRESDEGLDEDNGGENWESRARGSWWRGALNRSRREKFGDGRDDSDSDKDGANSNEDDEEFGDFAMPEVDKPSDENEKSNVIVKPLPVHPPKENSGKSSGFTSLWPFRSASKERSSGSKDDENPSEKEKDVVEKPSDSPKDATQLSEKDPVEAHEEIVRGENGEKIEKATEAKRRTSIEDPDDEEVVV